MNRHTIRERIKDVRRVANQLLGGSVCQGNGAMFAEAPFMKI